MELLLIQGISFSFFFLLLDRVQVLLAHSLSLDFAFYHEELPVSRLLISLSHE